MTAVRALLAVFTAVVLLLFQSAFWSSRVSSWMQVIVLAMALVSYFRPHAGLLALAVLVPLGQVGSRTLDSQMRGAEALVLAFLAGALVRGWTLRQFRSFPSTRVETAALVFGVVVAASCAEQIWFLQIQRDYPWPFLQSMLAYASHDYVVTFRGYGMIFRAMLLLEGMALLVFTLGCVRRSPEFARRLVVMLVAGAVATALLTFRDVLGEVAQARGAGSTFLDLVAERRWSAHIGDVNAAGSFFAMTMFFAFGLALKDRALRPVWIAAGVALAAVTVMTHSRTAIVAVALVAACLAAASTLGRALGVGRTIMVATLASAAIAAGLWLYLPRDLFGPFASEAVQIRWLFLGATWRMLLANPFFGVGIGQFALWSVHFAAPELLKYYPGENAHNNFAQIAGELGIVGLAGFVALLAYALACRRESLRQYEAVAAPVIVGLAAFMLSWLGGHPLLVPEVAYPFWLALGIVAVGSFATTGARHGAGLSAVVLLLLAVSIPIRVHAKSQSLDFAQVSYGLSARRIMTSRARFFVSDGTLRVEVPLRARGADAEAPLLIDVLVDDTTTETITIADREWQTARIGLPDDPSRRFHQVELRIRPSETTERAEDDDPSVEVGSWKLIPKPNG